MIDMLINAVIHAPIPDTESTDEDLIARYRKRNIKSNHYFSISLTMLFDANLKGYPSIEDFTTIP